MPYDLCSLLNGKVGIILFLTLLRFNMVAVKGAGITKNNLPYKGFKHSCWLPLMLFVLDPQLYCGFLEDDHGRDIQRASIV